MRVELAHVGRIDLGLPPRPGPARRPTAASRRRGAPPAPAASPRRGKRAASAWPMPLEAPVMKTSGAVTQGRRRPCRRSWRRRAPAPAGPSHRARSKARAHRPRQLQALGQVVVVHARRRATRRPPRARAPAGASARARCSGRHAGTRFRTRASAAGRCFGHHPCAADQLPSLASPLASALAALRQRHAAVGRHRADAGLVDLDAVGVGIVAQQLALDAHLQPAVGCEALTAKSRIV